MTDSKLDRLRKKQKEIAEQIRREETRLNAQKRKDDTRRKVLVGAFILDKTGKDAQYNGWLQSKLGEYLLRPDDRALFGLPPLPPAAPDAGQP